MPSSLSLPVKARSDSYNDDDSERERPKSVRVRNWPENSGSNLLYILQLKEVVELCSLVSLSFLFSAFFLT